MFQTIRTDSKNQYYRELVIGLDKEILKRDGKDFEFYDQFNSSDGINEVVIILEDNQPIGCGTFKKHDNSTAEIKQMYTCPDFRGKGVATLILGELETWALELNYKSFILETGKKYPEAISLYLKQGFHISDNSGPYVGVEDSVCFKKEW